MAALETIIIEPPVKAQACVIWLHGLGADGYDFADIVPALQLPSDHAIRFVFPHAPVRKVTLHNGYSTRAWYDIFAIGAKEHDVTGLQESDQTIKNLMKEAHASGIAYDKIILGGFSQGGAQSLYSGLRCAHTLAGIVCFSGYLADEVSLADQRHQANHHTPIFIAHGTEDNLVKYTWAEMAVQSLQAHAYQVRFESYKMGHTVCPAQLQVFGKWLESLL